MLLMFNFSYAQDYDETENIINSILKEEKKSPSYKKKDNSVKSTKKAKKGEGGESPTLTSQEEILLKSGIRFYNSQLYSNSLNNFQELIKKYPKSQFVDLSRLWSGKNYIKLYNYSKAIDEFSKIKDDSGEFPASLYYTAECHKLKGDNLVSIEYYQRMTSQFPDHELADNSLLKTGKLFLHEKKGSQALEAIVRLIKFYKSRETIDDAYYVLAKIFTEDETYKDIESARKAYKIFLNKANSGEKYFKDSPLKDKVKKELQQLEKIHFNMEQ